VCDSEENVKTITFKQKNNESFRELEEVAL